MFFNQQKSQRNSEMVVHSGHEEKETIIDYMLYYGVGIVECPAAQGGKFYMIKQVNDRFNMYKLQELTGYKVQSAYGYINLKGQEKMYFGTKEEAFSVLKQIHDLMEGNPLESDF